MGTRPTAVLMTLSLAAGLGLSACSSWSGRPNEAVICGQTVYAGRAMPVINQMWQDSPQTARPFIDGRLYIQLAADCIDGVDLTYSDPTSATAVRSISGQHGLVGIVLQLATNGSGTVASVDRKGVSHSLRYAGRDVPEAAASL